MLNYHVLKVKNKKKLKQNKTILMSLILTLMLATLIVTKKFLSNNRRKSLNTYLTLNAKTALRSIAFKTMNNHLRC